MYSRLGVAVAVACLVVVAGCGTFVGGSSQPNRETVTPVPVPDTDETLGGSDGSGVGTEAPPRPPGISPDGTVNVTALARVHEGRLANRSYAWTFRSQATRNDSELFTRAWRIRAGTDALLVSKSTTEGINSSIYVPNEVGYLRTNHGSRTSVGQVSQPRDRESYTALSGEMIRRFMVGVSFDVTVVDRNGQTYYRLHSADDVPTHNYIRALRWSPWNYTVTAYVTPGGFVRTLAVNYDRALLSSARHMSVRYDYTDVGSTTVERPDWVSEVTPSPTETPAVTNASTPPAAPTATAT